MNLPAIHSLRTLQPSPSPRTKFITAPVDPHGPGFWGTPRPRRHRSTNSFLPDVVPKTSGTGTDPGLDDHVAVFTTSPSSAWNAPPHLPINVVIRTRHGRRLGAFALGSYVARCWCRASPVWLVRTAGPQGPQTENAEGHGVRNRRNRSAEGDRRHRTSQSPFLLAQAIPCRSSDMAFHRGSTSP